VVSVTPWPCFTPGKGPPVWIGGSSRHIGRILCLCQGSNFGRPVCSQMLYWHRLIGNQYCIHEEIKSRLNSGNACYHIAQKILSSDVLCKRIQIKAYSTII
jgi:hypothetical protein